MMKNKWFFVVNKCIILLDFNSLQCLNFLNQICLKTFTRRPHLQEHMILHTQDRPFKCSYCDEFFKSRFARLKHQEKYHLGENLEKKYILNRFCSYTNIFFS